MKEKDLEEIGIVGDKPYLIRNLETLSSDVYRVPFKSNRTDEQRLKEYGIDSLDRLLEECILISQKQSKLPRSIRDIIVRISVEAFKELNMKAEEIKKESHNLTSLEEAKDRIIGEVGTERRDNYEKELKESLENNTKENDRQEQ